MSQHTLLIFEQLYRDLPPLVAGEVKQAMGEDLAFWQSRRGQPFVELEAVVVGYGKKTWPHRRAFHELVARYRSKLGEFFLRRKISKEIEKRYEEFLAHGGDFGRLYAGGPLGFFRPEERAELSRAMVEITRDIREHARQATLSVERDWYESRVADFCLELAEIEGQIARLKQLAEELVEEEVLAAEAREEIRAWEHGLSVLGSHPRRDQLENAIDCLRGRRRERALFRSAGIL